MDERSEPSPWERFLRAERRELELRRKGLLARLLNAPLPNESPEELARLAEEDRLRAQAGLLELRMPSGEVLYKRLEELLPEDRAARANAERARIAWLKERHQERMKAQGRSRAAKTRFDEERARLHEAQELESSARAEERSRIGRELHDRVSHTMGVAHQGLQLYEALKERDPEGAQAKLELAKRMVVEAMEQTRDLSQALRRTPTGAEGLEASLSRLLGDSSPRRSRRRSAWRETRGCSRLRPANRCS
jgi:signal transduction histidine kinase